MEETGEPYGGRLRQESTAPYRCLTIAMLVRQRSVKSIGLFVGRKYGWAFHARVVYSQPGALIPLSVTPLPGTNHQRGGRPVRQPKISGRTLRQCNIAEIITQSGTKCYKRVYKAIEALQNIMPSMAQLRVLTGSGRHK